MTNRRSILLDTNVLLLFVVGATERGLISRHKRTRVFTEEDFDLLCSGLELFAEVWVTPNILTETSNLAAQAGGSDGEAVMATLAGLINRFRENYVPSRQAAARLAFPRFGLADAATSEIAGTVDCILTDDLSLYLALLDDGRPAVNFNHVRQHGWSWE